MLFKLCIEENVKLRPNKLALIYKDKRYTFNDLKENVESYIKIYKKCGVNKNDRIVVYGKNSDIFIMQIFVCLKLGAIFIPVTDNITDEKLNYILKNSNAKYIFNIKDNELLHNINYNMKNNSEVDERKQWGCIIYTSGSTALPKGVLEAVDSILFVTKKINTIIGNTADDIILVALPLSFDYGLYQVFLSYQVGATIVLLEDFGLVQKLPGYIHEQGITGIPLVPSIFALLLKSNRMNDANMQTVRYICSTGDVLSVSLVNSFHEKFPRIDIIPMYGLTECKRVFIMPRARWDKIFAGSCGVPLEGIEVQIIEENGNCVPIGQIGELIVFGKNVMDGYWDDVNETKKRFITKADVRGVKTGDLFYSDQDGFYYFCGRKENYIKRRGIKVSPLEVENFILKTEGVLQCVVIGVKDEIEGEIIIALVSKLPDSDLDVIKLRMQFAKLPYEMRPTKIIITTEEIPRNSNGKYDRSAVAKFLLREMYDTINK